MGIEKSLAEQHKVYHLSTFRPEKCGIAYWTEDKINYLHGVDSSLRNRVIAVNGFRYASEYGDMVDFAFERDRREDYKKAAKFVNDDPEARLVWVEHEYGIFGGESPSSVSSQAHRTGSYLIDFLDSIKRPVGMTCHTVLKDAEEDEGSLARKNVMMDILPMVDRIITISSVAKDILVNEYDVDSDKVTAIYHGTHDFDESTEKAKEILGFGDRFVISTTGLVRKKRGMEHVIRALPEIVEKYPDVLYVIAGATHPKEIEDGREPYREELEHDVFSRGLENNVLFVNKSLPLSSLLRHIQASDICVTPYNDPRQVSSGVMSYCVGLGKPVISTPFLYAKDLLSDGRGIVLSDYGNSKSIEKAILGLMEDESRIERMKENIEPFIDQMRWKNVARTYLEAGKELIENAKLQKTR